MSDDDLHKIVEGADEPVPIMFFDPLEFVIVTTLVGAGIVLDFPFTGLILATGIMLVSRKLRQGAKRGAVQHYLWRIGLQLDSALARYFPAPWHNDYYK